MPPLIGDDRPNLFSNTAWLYDIDIAAMARHDLRFYRDYAQGTRNVLELACGTGRVALPLARAGHRVTAVDLSQPMLDVFRQKLSREPVSVADRVTIRRADMATFSLGQYFDLIIVPFRGFQALTNEEEISGCLYSIRNHLRADGRTILDVFALGDLETRAWQGESVDWVKKIPETGQTITRTRIRKRLDRRKQIVYSEIAYYIQEPDGTERTLRDPLALRYYRRYQMEYRLAASGFDIEAEFGDYDGRPPGRGPEQIYVARKSG
jgi:SAM-dependent methyltransferase